MWHQVQLVVIFSMSIALEIQASPKHRVSNSYAIRHPWWVKKFYPQEKMFHVIVFSSSTAIKYWFVYRQDRLGFSEYLLSAKWLLFYHNVMSNVCLFVPFLCGQIGDNSTAAFHIWVEIFYSVQPGCRNLIPSIFTVIIRQSKRQKYKYRKSYEWARTIRSEC